LGQVVDAWNDILQAVRHRNPTTHAALITGCRPVEVDGDEVVITFPYAILRDKLEHPERKSDIQDALNEILQARCRVRFVLAGDFRPRPQPAAPEAAGEPETAQSGPPPAAAEPEAAAQSGPPSAAPAAMVREAKGELDMDRLQGWVRSVGGQIVEG
jgi:hypothetical protein